MVDSVHLYNGKLYCYFKNKSLHMNEREWYFCSIKIASCRNVYTLFLLGWSVGGQTVGYKY